MNKIIIWVVVVVVVVAVIYAALMGAGTSAPASSSAPTDTSVGVASFPVIVFDGSSFVPDSVTVKKGETVTFRNDSATPVWPASAVHPDHKAYPTKGGCIGSTFDACRELAQGEAWPFTFEEVGTWKYHDHLNVKAFGTVIVQP